MRTRAVTQHVDWLVQKCDYLYIKTQDVNRIYLEFVRYIEIVTRHIHTENLLYHQITVNGCENLSLNWWNFHSVKVSEFM